VKLVLQCAMCGTNHPVGTLVCSTCRARGVAQLRLMFECQLCGRLDIHPVCQTCPQPGVPLTDPALELDNDLIVAEEVPDEPVVVDSSEGLAELAVDLEDLGALEEAFRAEFGDDEDEEQEGASS
jgi:hypothetical protein